VTSSVSLFRCTTDNVWCILHPCAPSSFYEGHRHNLKFSQVCVLDVWNPDVSNTWPFNSIVVRRSRWTPYISKMEKQASFSSPRSYGLVARGGSSLGRAFLHHIFSLALGSDQRYNHDRFGVIGRFLPWLGLINLPAVQRVHYNINCWSNDQVMAWKQSTIESCTTVAVVVSFALF
jgi:hypothetical protein